MEQIVIALLAVLVVFAALVFHELIKIRAALGALAVLRQRGLSDFLEDVKPAAQRSLFELSLKDRLCD